MTEIRTPRLLLRPAVAADLAAIHEILADPRATAYWSTPPHDTLDRSRIWLEGMIAIDPGAGEDFVVDHRGTVIGKAGLNRFPEIGFIFHPDAWGRGFAREALSAVINRGFERHRLPAIEADVDPRNEACLQLLARLGFREVGRAERTWLVGSTWCDSVYLSLDAKAWQMALVANRAAVRGAETVPWNPPYVHPPTAYAEWPESIPLIEPTNHRLVRGSGHSQLAVSIDRFREAR